MKFKPKATEHTALKEPAHRSGQVASSRRSAHLAETFRWSSEISADWVTIAASGIGMAGPALLGALLGGLPAGLLAATGSLLAIGGGAATAGGEERTARAEAVGLLPGLAAAVAAALAAGHGWVSDLVTTVLAGLAATIGGFSRPFAVATTRFVVLLIIVVAVGEASPHREGLLLLLLAGALWTFLVSLLLRAATAGYRRVAAADPAAPQPTNAQRLRRLRGTLRHLSGWQYPLRLVSCLAIAAVLRAMWPDHHLHWIALTVVLLSSRLIEPFPVQITQRALGTALGVLAAGLLLGFGQPPAWVLVTGVGLLGAARPYLRSRSYLAYSAVMTPLIVVIMDAGQPVGPGILVDRLVATLIGAGLVIAANLIVGRAVAKPA